MHALNTRTIGQAPAKTLAYDANGSQTYDGEKFGFEYDANDQLKVVFVDDGTNGGTAGDGLRNGGEPIVSAYRYDVMGRRVEKAVSAGYPEGASASTTRFYYSGQRIIEERNGEQGENEKVLAFYTYGSYIDEPLTMDRFSNPPPPPGEGQGEGAFVRYFFHHNRMFSTYALTDSTGTVAERYTYEAYGKVTTYAADYSAPQAASRVGNPFTFTGRELDAETGLMHYRARTYDPVEGRFKQTDPAGVQSGLNTFEYVASRAMNALDPDGLGLIGPTDPAWRQPPPPPLPPMPLLQPVAPTGLDWSPMADRLLPLGPLPLPRPSPLDDPMLLPGARPWPECCTDKNGKSVEMTGAIEQDRRGRCCTRSKCTVSVYRAYRLTGSVWGHSIVQVRGSSGRYSGFDARPSGLGWVPAPIWMMTSVSPLVVSGLEGVTGAHVTPGWRDKPWGGKGTDYLNRMALVDIPCSVADRLGNLFASIKPGTAVPGMSGLVADCRTIAAHFYELAIDESLKLDPPPCNRRDLKRHRDDPPKKGSPWW